MPLKLTALRVLCEVKKAVMEASELFWSMLRSAWINGYQARQAGFPNYAIISNPLANC